VSQLQGHSAAGGIMSMKISNDTIGNRTRGRHIIAVINSDVRLTQRSKNFC